VGIEAISRGAARVVFVERVEAALKTLRKNLERLGVKDGFQIQAGSAGACLRKLDASAGTGFDLVFLDPPYDSDEEYASTLGLLGRSTGLLALGALVIAEHRRKEKLEDRYGALERTRLLEQGDAALSFYAIAQPPA
jgi:16S rRNA (guanine(966)-N(2))-methyltransferase RsmD